MFRYSSGYFPLLLLKGWRHLYEPSPWTALWPLTPPEDHARISIVNYIISLLHITTKSITAQRARGQRSRHPANCDWVQHIHQSQQHDCWRNGVSQSARRAYKSRENTDICNFNAGAGLHSPLHVYQMEKQLNKCWLGSLFFFQLG